MAHIYRFEKSVYDGVDSYRVYTASGVSTGDLMQWDSDSRYAVPMTTASGAIFLGVSEESQPLQGLGSSTNPLTGDRIRIVAQGVHAFKTTTSETYVHLTPVFMGADTQTVTTVSAGRMIGRVHLPDGSSVTGASGTSISVRIFGSMANVSNAPSSAAADR